MSILNDLKICYYLSKLNSNLDENKKDLYERKLREVFLL